MDKILVTGVAGFLGSNLAKYLLQNERNIVYGIDNFSSSTMSNLYPLLKNERFEFIEHNLHSNIDIEADYVFHLAGNGDLSRYFSDNYNFILNSIEITKNIIEYSKRQGSRLLLTTQYLDYQEYNKNLFKYFDTLKIIENLTLDLIDNNKLNAVIVRLDNVYGENLLKTDERFISRVIVNILNNRDVELNFEQAYYYTYVQDVVLNMDKIIKTFTNDSVIDVINENLYLNSDIAKFIIKYAKSNSKLILNSSIQHTPDYLPAKNKLNLSCDTNILDGILKTVNYFKLMYFS